MPPKLQKFTSCFLGVTGNSKHKNWCSEIKEVGYQGWYETEAEAAAHYNAVMRAVGSRAPKNPDGTPRYNNLADIRPDEGYWEDRDGYRWRKINIDQENFAIVDNETIYLVYKDKEWFMLGGEAVLIAKVTEKPWTFSYVSMSELLLKQPAEHLNGDPLDNRRCNLVPVGQLPIPKPLSEKRPSRPLVNFKVSKERAQTPIEARFVEDLAAYEKWKEDVAAGRPVEREVLDPRMMERYQHLLYQCFPVNTGPESFAAGNSDNPQTEATDAPESKVRPS